MTNSSRFATAAPIRTTFRIPSCTKAKGGEWGYLDGRPVVVDYAMRVHMTDEDIALIDPSVRTIDAVRRYFGER